MRKLLALALALAPQVASSATLTGDAVTLTFNPSGFERNETVGAGVDITQLNFLFDLDAGLGDGLTWDSNPLSGYLGSSGITFSGLDFSGGEILSGFTLISTVLRDLAFTFTDHSLTFTWSNDPDSYVGPGSILSGTFQTSAVPLPAGLPLVLTGVGALVAFGRRRKARAA